jgi:hypothetical protein
MEHDSNDQGDSRGRAAGYQAAHHRKRGAMKICVGSDVKKGSYKDKYVCSSARTYSGKQH